MKNNYYYTQISNYIFNMITINILLNKHFIISIIIIYIYKYYLYERQILQSPISYTLYFALIHFTLKCGTLIMPHDFPKINKELSCLKN